ncbi:MAG TPA: hypothetical protein HA302_07535 [Thermococcaceae archaeon]|nr:hypothetical protein [Thermococcaceae archaeon]
MSKAKPVPLSFSARWVCLGGAYIEKILPCGHSDLDNKPAFGVMPG